MGTFIEDYLSDPSQAISDARLGVYSKFWTEYSDDEIYRELQSPEFHLYEEMILSGEVEITPHASGYAVVA